MSTTIGELTVIVTTRQAVAKTAARTRIFSSRGDNTPLFVWGHRVAADADGNSSRKETTAANFFRFPQKRSYPAASLHSKISCRSRLLTHRRVWALPLSGSADAASSVGARSNFDTSTIDTCACLVYGIATWSPRAAGDPMGATGSILFP
jgi:hypothetical protein